MALGAHVAERAQSPSRDCGIQVDQVTTTMHNGGGDELAIVLCDLFLGTFRNSH